MDRFNPYHIDEIVAEASAKKSCFGLIGDAEADRTELHGYEVTMSGRLVLPVLHTQTEPEAQKKAA